MQNFTYLSQFNFLKLWTWNIAIINSIQTPNSNIFYSGPQHTQRVMEEKRTLKMLRVVAGGVLESGLQPPSSSSSSPNRGTSPRRLVSGWFSLWSLAFAESIRLRASRMMVLTVAADALEPVVCCPLCWPGGSSPPSSWSTLNKFPNVDKVPEWK